MTAKIVQFEAEIRDPSRIRSRVVWPDSAGPWIEGGLEDLMVHFTYAGWTAFRLGLSLSMILSSQEEQMGQTVSDMMSKLIQALGAVELAEVRLTRDALEELKRDRIEP
ncbi:MAG: hypothetical protein HPY61_14265 [Methanotrichaceae archaeon]|nr:hypothetical protein [Methanotrichaceae archaeon]